MVDPSCHEDAGRIHVGEYPAAGERHKNADTGDHADEEGEGIGASTTFANAWNENECICVLSDLLIKTDYIDYVYIAALTVKEIHPKDSWD